MFPKSMAIEKAFRYIRLFTIMVVIGSMTFSGFVCLLSIRAVARAQERVYILAAGKALEAVASDRKENIPVEARDHIRSFHQYFFTLDPDEKVIETNLSKALYLADASAKRLYDNLKENAYYSGVISGNISQMITVDSIVLDRTITPFISDVMQQKRSSALPARQQGPCRQRAG